MFVFYLFEISSDSADFAPKRDSHVSFRALVGQDVAMLTAIALAAALQATALPDDPVYAFQSLRPAPEVADCAMSSLKGQRLGANIFTLRPQISRVFDGYLIQIGPTIRITVQPDGAGSKLRLYSPNFVRQLSDKLDICRGAVEQ